METKGSNVIFPFINELMKKQEFSKIIAVKDWHPENHSSFAIYLDKNLQTKLLMLMERIRFYGLFTVFSILRVLNFHHFFNQKTDKSFRYLRVLIQQIYVIIAGLELKELLQTCQKSSRSTKSRNSSLLVLYLITVWDKQLQMLPKLDSKQSLYNKALQASLQNHPNK